VFAALEDRSAGDQGRRVAFSSPYEVLAAAVSLVWAASPKRDPPGALSHFPAERENIGNGIM
jgi:hypothetical protein